MNPDRYFDPDPTQRALARELYETVATLPLICPHGHVDPRLFADPDYSFGSPVDLLIIPDHYVFRMLYSQNVSLEALGIPRRDGVAVETDHRKIWQTFADHYYLFRGTPTGVWFDDELSNIFGVREKLTSQAAPAHLRSDRGETGDSRNFARAPCSNASTSRCCAPPMRQPIRWFNIKRSALQAGRATSGQPSGPMA